MKNKSPIRYSKAYRVEKVIDDFLKTFYHSQLNYLASDLLDKGYQPEDILQAVSRAMKICKTGDIDAEKHFMPLYSDRNGVTIRDCKMSLFGYRLLMLNANPEHPSTARFQINALTQISSKSKSHKAH